MVIHVISKFLKDNLSEHVKRDERDIALIYDGIDTDFFNYNKINIKKSRKRYTSKFPLISCVSHFKFPQKRQDLLVKSMTKVKEEYPDALLLLVGAGDSTKMESLIDELGLNKNIRILGPKTPEVVREIMAVSDVSAFITSFEGMGIVAVETLAMGTPIVATKVGPLPEIIRDGKDGLMTSLEVDDISNGLIKVISDKSMLSEMKEKRKWIENNFNWNNICKKLENELLAMVK